jgi:hypothetical protein
MLIVARLAMQRDPSCCTCLSVAAAMLGSQRTSGFVCYVPCLPGIASTSEFAAPPASSG